MKAARVMTFSDAERLATVDRGWGLLTRGGKTTQVKFKTMPKPRRLSHAPQHIKIIGTFSKYGSRVLVWFCTLDG